MPARQLDEKMSEAAAQEASPPVGALRADFAAQLEVTRAVIAFAQVCPAEGPDRSRRPARCGVRARDV